LPELTPESLTAAKPVVDACPAGEENLPVRWAALLGALGEADTRRVLKRLRCSNACIEETAVLVRETAEQGVCGSFLLGHEFELRHPTDASCLEQHSHPVGRCPNSNSLFPPQAAVVAVAGHSIARPIAFGNRACMACWLWARPSASTIWFFHRGMVLTMVDCIFSAIMELLFCKSRI